MALISINNNFWIVSYTIINQSIWMSRKLLKDFLTNLFFSINQVVMNSMVIEPHLTILIINLNQFLHIILFFGWSIMLYCFEHVWKSSSHEQLVSSIPVVISDLSGNDSFVIFINGHLLNQTINLSVVRKEFNFALFIIKCLFTFRA